MLFVLMEYALVRVRPARIELLARKGNPRAVRVQEMMTHLDDYLAAIQVGITMVGLALGAFAEPPITKVLQGWTERLLGDLPDAPLRVVSLAVGLGILAYAQIVVGELLPRAIALRKAEALALWGSLPLKVFAMVCRLPVYLMSSSSRALLKLVRLAPGSETEGAISEDEIRVIMSETQEKGTLPFERLILHENLFDLSQSKARDAMTPRERIALLSLAKSWPENLETIKARRFSRYPLCRQNLDDVVGFIHLKDLVLRESGPSPDLQRIRRDITTVTESTPLERLLKDFPDKGTHLALVNDERGAITGLITLEDLIEEMVGEVQDEFDLPQSWSLADVLVPSANAVQLEAADAEGAIRLMLDRLVSAEPSINREAALRAVMERERRLSSAVGLGVAVPHARLPELKRAFVALGRLAKPLPLAASPDRLPLRLIFLILTPSSAPVAQLKILSRIAALVSNEGIRRRLIRAKTPETMLELMRTADTLLAT
ncbi:MAG: DUF21 domain-containing protein [Elusimicrobia bacterium]|nr:DUF21 domain-containing protein [Elusimicrobiota bacterium]